MATVVNIKGFCSDSSPHTAIWHLLKILIQF